MRYNCPLCPKKYQSQRDFKHHVKKIHGIDWDNMTTEQADFIVNRCAGILGDNLTHSDRDGITK